MYQRLFSLIIVALIFPFHLCSQTDVKIRKKEFRTDRAGFEAAWQHVVEGDSYFKTGGTWYGNAFEEYSKAVLYNNFNPELNYKTGVAALFSDNKESAAEYFQRVLIAESGLTGDLDTPMVCGNMMAAARSLGIGSCWVYFGQLPLDDPGVQKMLEIKEGEKVFGPILLGYPQKNFPAPPQKKPAIVKWV